MIKQINKLLKLVGFNLVRAKRPKVKWTGRLTISTAGPEIDSPLLPKCSDGNTKLSDYMGETEWQNTPPVAVPVPNPGKTHYVGDDCPGGHCEVADGAPAPTFDDGLAALKSGEAQFERLSVADKLNVIRKFCTEQPK